MVKEKVTVLVTLVRRHCYAVGAALRRAVDDEVPSAVEKKTEDGPSRGAPFREQPCFIWELYIARWNFTLHPAEPASVPFGI